MAVRLAHRPSWLITSTLTHDHHANGTSRAADRPRGAIQKTVALVETVSWCPCRTGCTTRHLFTTQQDQGTDIDSPSSAGACTGRRRACVACSKLYPRAN